MENRLEVLDKGYVRVREVMGSDLSVVNAARVSYDKESTQLSGRDEGLIGFLAREGHTSPFRHAMISFEVYAPLFVARQWWKYIIGSAHQDPMLGWNESSRRYITENSVFYIPRPHEWRSAPANSKQGSGDPIDPVTGQTLTSQLTAFLHAAEQMYEKALKDGVAPEQARLFLPAYGMYVRWVWTASLQGVAHLIAQRTAPDAQQEFQDYAQSVYALAAEKFPVSLPALLQNIKK